MTDYLWEHHPGLADHLDRWWIVDAGLAMILAISCVLFWAFNEQCKYVQACNEQGGIALSQPAMQCVKVKDVQVLKVLEAE